MFWASCAQWSWIASVLLGFGGVELNCVGSVAFCVCFDGVVSSVELDEFTFS